MSLSRRYLACALVATFMVSCVEAARAQVGVPQVAPVAPVGVSPVGAVVTVAPVSGALPIEITPMAGAASVKTTPLVGLSSIGSASGINAPIVSVSPSEGASGVNASLWLLMGQIAAGQITLDEAWSKGLLDAPKTLQLLGRSARLTDDESNETLQRDLTASLVRLAPETVAAPEKLSARVRLFLCRYYSSIGDARAVPLCETLIVEKLQNREEKVPARQISEPDDQSFWLRSIIALAQYYEKAGQWQKAGETWERALGFWQDANWWQASIRLEATRFYTAIPGKEAKARELYAQVPRYGDAWFSGIAITDQADELMRQHKFEAARALLNQTVTGLNSEKFRVVMLYYMARSYLSEDKDGNMMLAEKYAQAALTQAESLSPQQQDELQYTVGQAENILKAAQQWHSPIFTEKTEVRMVMPNKQSTAIGVVDGFLVRTRHLAKLIVNVDNPSVKVSIEDIPPRVPVENNPMLGQLHMINLTCAVGALSQSFEGTITVIDPKFPEFQLRVPLHIEVPTPDNKTPNAEPITPLASATVIKQK